MTDLRHPANTNSSEWSRQSEVTQRNYTIVVLQWMLCIYIYIYTKVDEKQQSRKRLHIILVKAYPATCWIDLSTQTHFTVPDRDMLLNHKLSVKLKKVALDDLKSWDDESDVLSLCFTLKVLITDQVGGPVHHLHHLSAAMQYVNDEGVLHKGNCAAVVPLGCVYSART